VARRVWLFYVIASEAEPKKPLALSEQKLALSVAEWVEGVAISLLQKLEMDTSASDRRIAST